MFLKKKINCLKRDWIYLKQKKVSNKILNYLVMTNRVDIKECDQDTLVFLNLQKLGWIDKLCINLGKQNVKSRFMHVNTMIDSEV